MRYEPRLPRDEYEKLLKEQDVGIISLSSSFTIPNFPSRILSYMQMAKPVLVTADRVTDMGALVTGEAGCGFYTPSDDVEGFVRTVRDICDKRDMLPEMGRRGRKYLEDNYDVALSVKLIEKYAKESI